MRKKRPYRWTSIRKKIAIAMKLERDACHDEALAWCTHKTDPEKQCIACAIAASIAARDE